MEEADEQNEDIYLVLNDKIKFLEKQKTKLENEELQNEQKYLESLKHFKSKIHPI